MHRIFLPIYRYFRSHKAVLYLTLGLSALLFIIFGVQLRYEEDVAKLLPRSSVESELAFSDIGLKDKIFIQITSANPEEALDTWTLSDYIDEFTQSLEQRDTTGRYIRCILSSLEVETALGAMDYGFEHLPSLIDTSFYAAFAEALAPAAIDAQMSRNVELIGDDATGETTQMVCTDPFALRDIFLARLMPEGAAEGSVGDYTIENGHFFCPDRSVAMAFLSPSFQQTDSGTSTRFARILNLERKAFEAAHPDARIYFHGAPLGAVSNAGTIKQDLVWTVGISLLVILTILACAVIPLLFVGAMLLRTPLMTMITAALAVGMLVALWLSGVFERPTNVMITVLYAVAIIAVVVLTMIPAADTGGDGAAGEDGSGAVVSAQTGEDLPGMNEVSSETTPAPTVDDSATDESINAASYFLSYWQMRDYEQMVNLCTRSWTQSLNSGADPKNELYGLLKGRSMLEYTYQSASGTINDQRREIVYEVLLTLPNNSESRQILKISVARDTETGRWLVDPQSIVSNAPASTPTSASTMATQPPVPAAADPNTLLYYNPDGGSRYHIDRNCSSTSVKYLPLAGVFTYSQLNEEPYKSLTPCMQCGAPLRTGN